MFFVVKTIANINKYTLIISIRSLELVKSSPLTNAGDGVNMNLIKNYRTKKCKQK